MNSLGDLLQQFTGDQSPNPSDDKVNEALQNVPQSTLSDGLAAAFRSDQTPAFGQMAAQLFSNSNPQQRAGMLNTLISVAGPALLAQLSSRGGGGGGGGLSGLAGLLAGGQQTVTPEQAEGVSPEAVAELAAEAEQKDPSIIDQMSNFYAEHPTLVKTLGAAAVAIALQRMTRQS